MKPKSNSKSKKKNSEGIFKKLYNDFFNSKIGNAIGTIFVIFLAWLLGGNWRVMIFILLILIAVFIINFLFNHQIKFSPRLFRTKKYFIIILPLLLPIAFYVIINPFSNQPANDSSNTAIPYDSIKPKGVPIQSTLISKIDNLIIPSNDPTPPNKCPTLPPNSILLLAGNVGMFLDNSLDSTNVISIKGHSLLSFKKNKYGFFVSLDLYDKNGINICETINNKIVKNKNNYSTIDRPDSHTLLVKDWENNQVLYLKFINPRTISILGTLFYPPNFFVDIQQNTITTSGLTWNGGCAGDSKNVLVF